MCCSRFDSPALPIAEVHGKMVECEVDMRKTALVSRSQVYFSDLVASNSPAQKSPPKPQRSMAKICGPLDCAAGV